MERFHHNPTDFVGFAGAHTVYVGVASREKFDALDLPCVDHGENDNGHVLSKQVGSFSGHGVTVIFQYWIKSKTYEAIVEDLKAKNSQASQPAADPLGDGKAEEAPASDRARRNDAGSLLPHGEGVL